MTDDQGRNTGTLNI